jgi:RNA polymerase sigma factor (sigma-70 family)
VFLHAKHRYAPVVASAAMRPRMTVPIKDISAVPVCDPRARAVVSARELAADLDLMRRAAANQPEAQRELVERVIGQVRARARKLTHSDADADDATQTAIMEILRSAKNFRGEGKLEAWCERVTVRTIVRQQRGRARALASIADIDPDRLEHPRASHTQVREPSVWRFIAELSDDRQEALQLWAIGFSVEEIAAQTETSPNTVKDRLRMARRQLRQSMRQREVIASVRSITPNKPITPITPITPNKSIRPSKPSKPIARKPT